MWEWKEDEGVRKENSDMFTEQDAWQVVEDLKTALHRSPVRKTLSPTILITGWGSSNG
jgi:hypothetical protein